MIVRIRSIGHGIFLTLSVFATKIVALNAEESNHCDANSHHHGPSSCAAGESYNNCPLWLAPSYTGTDREPKYGLFAGKAYGVNETLPVHAELAIPLVDFNFQPTEQFQRNPAVSLPNHHAQLIDFLEGFFWTANFVGAQCEGEYSAPAAIPGIGVLSHYHSGISNVNFHQASVLLRKSPSFLKAGEPHLSRGAITTYHNVTLQATREIPLGMEFFADFGDVWDETSGDNDDAYQDTIRRSDYEKADTIISDLVTFFQEFPDLSRDLQEEIVDFMVDDVLGEAAGKHAKTIRSLIPSSPRKVAQAQAAGGSFLYRYREMIRSSDWLQQNGFCLDTLRAGPSRIPSAGWGAFATRRIQKGETITVSPMLHIADKEILNMYPVGETSSSTQSIGKQMILNYCFGHPESSLLLFPLGSLATLINHQSGKSSNAYVTWSRRVDKLPNQHQYHDYTVEQMAEVSKIVLTMKVVATSDIAEGDEIFLDYGPQWVAAWNDYQARWQRDKQGNSHPLRAQDLRDQYRTKPFAAARTKRPPYPVGVATACFLNVREVPDGKPMFDEALRVEIVEWSSPTTQQDYHGRNLFIVDVLDRAMAPEHFFNYTVLAKFAEDRIEEIVNVPHEACTFVDLPYQGDISLPGAFRHPIGIIDGHFPQKWRNLKGTKSKQ
ncbi:unnamed protein product [Cylindrotheca closterium]|uniref:SET domain-containing protein n=1 Tax=Cylindrotheca closterium TaxID=2856 RepID=A0AAD2G3P4_9STRA|nr:unnamed protein product [Cylindrotheca closterium]